MDQPFPIVGDAGQVLHLSNPAALFVITMKNGFYLDEEPYPKFTRAELEKQEEELTARPYNPDEGQATVFDIPDEPVTPKMPYGNAPKAAWIRYARAIDAALTQERADGMTKADLMSRYGERL